jgi:hypothetical protein
MREKPDGDNVEVTIGDMSRVTTGRTYLLVYLVYNTIGNLLTQDDQIRCFENAARHLTDDGVFVLECPIPTAPSRPGHQFVDAEAVGVDHVSLDVCRYDPVTKILDENHVRISTADIVLSPSVCASPTHPSSTSWLASPTFGCAIDGEVGALNRTPPPAGATSASTNEQSHDESPTRPQSG